MSSNLTPTTVCVVQRLGRLVVVQKTRVQLPPYTPSPHRLMVRTPGFHPGNRSSILLGGTDKEASCQSMSINVSNVIQNKH